MSDPSAGDLSEPVATGPTSPARDTPEDSVRQEREALAADTGSAGPENERPVLVDGKRPGEDTAQ